MLLCIKLIPAPPTDVTSFEQFENDLGKKLRGPDRLDGFSITPTLGSSNPVGTIFYDGSTRTFIECKVTEPPFRPMDDKTLMPVYSLTSGVALDLGLNGVITRLSSAGIKFSDSSSVSLQLDDARIQQLSDVEVQSLLSQQGCTGQIGKEKDLRIVRGYVQAKRIFSIKLQRGGAFNVNVKIAGFDVKFDKGTETMTINDSVPTNFLQITSPVANAGATPASTASSLILASSTATIVEPQQKGLVYIQIDAKDLPINGDKVRQILVAAKFPVAKDIERIPGSRMPTTPQVRYFNIPDKDRADKAVALLKPVYPDTFAKYVGLPAPAGQLEVWLARIKGE